jgi:membrane fusion protein (multidrug efflux system)
MKKYLSYAFAVFLTVVFLAGVALALHPAKPYIVPGVLGGMGVTPGTWPAWAIVNGVPLLALLMLVRLAIWGRPAMRRFVLILVPVSAVIVTGYQAFLKSQPGGWPQSPPGIVAQKIQMRPFADRIEALGTAQSNESTALAANVTETVAEILFEEGQFVTKDTVLVQLNDDQERASLIEAEKAYNRAVQLKRTSAVADARVDADRARLDVARAQVRDRQIVAPFDGVLGLRSISVGDIVNPGTVITTIDDVDPIKLEFSVPENYMSAVRVGMAIEATSGAYPAAVFRGAITAIDPRIDPITRSLKIKAEIANEDGRLRAGMLMVTNIVNNVRDSMAISEEALVSMGDKKSVMRLGDAEGEGDNQVWPVEARDVTIGARMAGYVEVLSGLKAGDRVVVDGVIKAKPGAKVKIISEKPIEETIDRALENAVPGKKKELGPVGLPEHQGE